MLDEPITIDIAMIEIRGEILGKKDWLKRFGHGSAKPRPEYEIARYQKRLAVLEWVLAALERKQAA